MSKHKCSDCTHSIWCSTWGSWKCLSKKRRIYSDFDQLEECPDYKKRGKDFKESKCQCEECLANESLLDEGEE